MYGYPSCPLSYVCSGRCPPTPGVFPSAECVVPQLRLEPPEMSFKHVFVGSSARGQLTVINPTVVVVEAAVDLSQLPEYRLKISPDSWS